MIPQIGFAEMLLIAVLALIVVGPKDLPVMMRRAGQFFVFAGTGAHRDLGARGHE